MSQSHDLQPELFLDAGFRIISDAYRTLSLYARYGLKRASQQIIDKNKSNSNQPILADKYVEESAFLTLLQSPLGQRLEKKFKLQMGDWIYGEETIDRVPVPIDFTNTIYPVVLLDMLDGSDLFKRRFSNWCIAVVFYVPKPTDIIAAFVGDALGRIYYASKFEEGAFLVSVKTSKTRRVSERIKLNPLEGRVENPKLENSVVCFYGQKRNDFYDVAKRKNFIDSLDPEKGARIYNLGGNPMIARVADGTVDIVISPGRGQKVHDVFPGLYIAIKSGASALSPEGEDLTFNSEYLIKSLQHPADDTFRLRYIVAATNDLAKEVSKKLKVNKFG